MPPQEYSRMGLIRLSPQTGQMLTRLNILEGQIIRGRVYKMENFSGGGTAPESGADTGGVAKIAFGSHLIDAVVSKSLPEGARVAFEVVKIAEENFVLKLLSIEEPKTSDMKNAPPINRSDLAEWSNEAQQANEPVKGPVVQGSTMVKQGEPGISELSRKLVDLPQWSEIPKPAARIIISAINNGFLDAATFEVKSPVIRTTIADAFQSVQSDIAKLSQNTAPVVRELAESIKAIVEQLRPIIESLPSARVIISGTPTEAASTLKEYAQAVRSWQPMAPPEKPPAQLPVQPAIEPASQAALQPKPATGQAEIRPVITGQTSAIPSEEFHATAQDTTKPSPQPAAPQAPAGEALKPVTVDTKPIVVQAETPIPAAPQSQTIAAKVDIPVPVNVEIKPLTLALDPNKLVTPAQEQIKEGSVPKEAVRVSDTSQARDIVLGLRVLAALSDRIARSQGIAVDDSAKWSAHSSRLASLADSFEGALISPLLTRSAELPHLVPRLLLSFMFPSGHGEMVAFQPLKKDSRQPDGKDKTDERVENKNTTGIIRLHTENMGDLRIRVDYREAADDAEQSRVSGMISAMPDTANRIRQDLKSLDGALDARGIKSDGFRVVRVRVDEKSRDDKPDNTSGGIDIRI